MRGGEDGTTALVPMLDRPLTSCEPRALRGKYGLSLELCEN